MSKRIIVAASVGEEEFLERLCETFGILNDNSVSWKSLVNILQCFDNNLRAALYLYFTNAYLYFSIFKYKGKCIKILIERQSKGNMSCEALTSRGQTCFSKNWLLCRRTNEKKQWYTSRTQWNCFKSIHIWFFIL